MKSYIKNIIPASALLFFVGLSSCTSDLDVTPIDPNLNTEINSDDLFNKCYANLAVAGNGGANGDSDVDGIDGGTSGYYRQMWNSNELTTDEAICGWGDEGISSFVYDTYDASHPMLAGYYYRLYVGIAFCNQYIEQFGDVDATKTAEVRFIRALNYYLLMDAFGNVPFTTTISSAAPQQYTRQQVFNFVESELKDIESSLNDANPKSSSDSGYGRVDKAADWLLLARLYLNAEVYTGTAHWSEAAQYAKQVMDSPYNIYNGGTKGGFTSYQQLFMGDNGENGAYVEGIFPLLQDGLKTTSWGTSLFLIASTWGDDMFGNPNDEQAETRATNGTTEKWSGNRARKELVEKFFPNDDAPEGLQPYAMAEAAGDDRALFCSNGRTLSNGSSTDDVSTYTNGFSVGKFTNFKTDGTSGHSSQFPDADVFLFRAAEANLIYAEATARQNGGSTTAEGTAAINELRTRANATTRSGYSLSDICDEWSREFYFEGLRRPTLIRFGRFGGDNGYNWSWKGGTATGRNFSSNRNIFAIPTNDLNVNPNLKQNPGY